MARHPANIPSARVHLDPDGTVELHVRFDILAFCLEETPQQITDGPMNALLDGPASELENRLADAQNRFRAETSVLADNGNASFDSIRFPSSNDVEECARENGTQRLPVMLTVVMKEKLPEGAKTVSCKFPDVLGSVVVTTEMPYEEPVSEPVDPGSSSDPLQIPTAPQIAQAEAAAGVAATSPEKSVRVLNTSARPASERVGKTTKAESSKPQVIGRAEPTPSPTKAAVDNKLEQASARLSAPSLATGKLKATVKPKPAASKMAIGTSAPAVAAAPNPLEVTGNPMSTIPLGRPAWYVLFGRYVRMGYRHILPEGLDHILFVLGLFLLSRKTKPLLTQISCFTIAHSITLGLSLYGVFSLPSSIVEPLIALSIVFVAIENIFTSEMKAWRPLVVFGFGLVHGLGFAGALKGAGLAKGDFLTGLVGFNCGVELGQLSVVLLAFLTVGWFRTKPSYRMAVVLPGSVLIALVAAFWTIQRIV